MKIALLFRKLPSPEKIRPDDLIGRSDIAAMKTIKDALISNGHIVTVVNPECIDRLRKLSVDVAFNLSDDGFRGESRLEPHIPALLDVFNVPYTGSNYLTLGLCLSKPTTKQLLLANKIPTPNFQLFETGKERINKDLNFPLIVKPSREDASIGITNCSVVTTHTALRRRIDGVISTFNQPALAEEYIKGREFNVGIIGNSPPIVLPLSEIIFSLPKGMNNICSYQAKWISGHRAYRGTQPQCPANVSLRLGNKLRRLAVESYRLMGCRDYGRVDFRVDASGRPYVLEVNPNPDISPSAGLANMASKAGISYAQLVERIVNYAAGRYVSCT